MPDYQTVIAIDDEPVHLTGLANSLNRHGVPCQKIYFSGEPEEIEPCPYARLIFADLHLGRGVLGSDPTTDFSVLGALLEDSIRPTGPYLMLLWTMYPDQASALQTFLGRLNDVPKPTAVLPLAKADYLDSDGNVKDEAELMKTVNELAKGWVSSQGGLALAGMWGAIDNNDVDTLVNEIYESRRKNTGRNVEFED